MNQYLQYVYDDQLLKENFDEIEPLLDLAKEINDDFSDTIMKIVLRVHQKFSGELDYDALCNDEIEEKIHFVLCHLSSRYLNELYEFHSYIEDEAQS